MIRMMKSNRSEIAKTLRYANFPGLLILGFIAAACYTAAQMYLPVALSSIIDEVLTGNRPELLVNRVTVLALSAMAMAIFQGAQRITFTVLGERSLINLRRDLLPHLQRLPASFFDNERSGSLHSL